MSVRRGEIEGHEFRKGVFEYVFLGAIVGIVIILWVGHGTRAAE